MTQTTTAQMTHNDLGLIALAQKIHYSEWYEVNRLIPLADTDECRRRLKDIRIELYHRDEWHAGLL